MTIAFDSPSQNKAVLEEGAAFTPKFDASGLITAVEGVEELRGLPDVLAVDVAAGPGMVVRETRDNWDRLGMVAVTAPDTGTAVRRCEELTAAVRVRMAGTSR